VSEHLARAQGLVARKRFIGCYVPNGAYMPDTVDGNWTWNEALVPLAEKNLKNNTILFRGIFAGFKNDPHWQNCAGFLSCQEIQLGDPGVARCGVSIDQHIAERHPSPIRSLEIGGLYYHVHPLNDHPGYSNDYLNRISWQTPDKFRTPIPDPVQMFAKLFGAQGQAAAQIAYLHRRRKSVLDQVHRETERLSMRLPGSYQPVLTSYMETIREVEKGLQAMPPSSCTPNFNSPSEDFRNQNTNYVLRFELMHKMIVIAMKCGLTNVATIMYGPAVSEQLNFAQALGNGANHHNAAHHGNSQGEIARIKSINVLQVKLLADLLDQLRTAGLLESTLVMYGSDMSDGNKHLTENLPVLLCGAGADLKFGQTVGARNMRRPLSDLHMDVLSLLDVKTVTSMGSGVCKSTGRSLEIGV
jgi:hypothetical protein